MDTLDSQLAQSLVVEEGIGRGGAEDIDKKSGFKIQPKYQDIGTAMEAQNALLSDSQSNLSPESLSKLSLDLTDCIDVDQILTPEAKDVQLCCSLCYNIAVVNFHSMNYSRAEHILSKLVEWPSLPDISCNTVIKIRLLYIDTLVRMRKFSSALIQIEYFEVLRAQIESELNKSPSPGTSSPTMGKPENDEWDYGLKTRIQFYKTYCSLATRSFRIAKRECKILFGLLGTSSQCHVGAMHLKAYQEYLRGNMTKAVNLIRSIPPNATQKAQELLNLSGDLLSVVGPNNEGCCQFYLGRPLSAGMLFKKAIVAYDEDVDTTNLSVHAVNFKRNLIECLYNFGIACLHAKDTDRAFYCLMGCTKLFGSNPRLWLRIAECCIQKFKQTNEDDMQWTEEKKNLLQSIKCSKYGAPKLILSEKFNDVRRDEQHDPGKSHQPSLSFGSTCIKTALTLIIPDHSDGNITLQVPPSNPLTNERAINSLHASILCAGAFIAISIEDYHTAAKYSEEMLNLPNLVGALRYLGKQYLSQAYFMMGDVGRAVNIIEADYNNLDLNYCVSPIESAEDRRDDAADAGWSNAGSSLGESNGPRKPLQVWHPTDEMTAKMIRVYNHACLLACSGKLDKADEVLRVWMTRSNGVKLPPEFLMLAVYLHIQTGNINKAVSLLKEHSPTAPVT